MMIDYNKLKKESEELKKETSKIEADFLYLHSQYKNYLASKKNAPIPRDLQELATKVSNVRVRYLECMKELNEHPLHTYLQ